MVDRIRQLWCEKLQKLLECPVCYDLPKIFVFQCVNGHHVCRQCKTRLLKCPLCKDMFISTRNLMAETLSAQLEEMQLSILESAHEINKKAIPNVSCSATQTEDIVYIGLRESESHNTGDEELRGSQQVMTFKPPNVSKGNYPCRIGSCCSKLPYARIINHLRYYHKYMYYKFQAEDGKFFKKLILEFAVPKNYDFAFEIKNLGLFFINIKIETNGNLMGIVQVVNSMPTVRMYSYKLQIGEGDQDPSYDGQITSCRSSAVKYLQVPADNLQSLTALNGGHTITCLLSIRLKSLEEFANKNLQPSSSNGLE